MQIRGQCHCGTIKLALDWPRALQDLHARACDCSFCVKHGCRWIADADASLVIDIDAWSDVSAYAFGTRTATFHVCSRCGAVPVATCTVDDRLYAVVNVNVLDDIDAPNIRSAAVSLDGEDVNSRTARRTRNWIASVRIDVRHASTHRR